MTYRPSIFHAFSSIKAPCRQFMMCFLVVSAMTIAVVMPTILASTIEATDQAANSLLVQEAKTLSLLTGNYSRIGFFHPGPAIIYVLAAGEWLFFDILHITKFPIQGQIIAAAFYTSFWLSLSWHVLSRLHGSLLIASAFIAIYSCVISYSEPSVFNSLWFPFLYATPFGCFVISLAGVLTLDSICCLYMALAAGFLTNGHASFIGITAITAVIAFSIKYFVYSLQRKKDLIVTRKDIIFALFGCLIVGIFFIPLALRDLVFHEGTVRAYLSFARQGQSHNATSSLNFLFQRFGSSPAERILLAVATVLCLLSIHRRQNGAIAVACMSATIATYCYIAHGVDDLHMQYLIIFYSTVPAMIVATASAQLIPRSRQDFVLMFISVTAASLTFLQVYRVSIGTRYSEPTIRDINESINSHFSSKVALNISDAHDVSLVWPLIVGVELYRIRNHEDMRFCINYNWWILYRKQDKCAEPSRPAYLVESELTVSHPLPTGAFKAGSLVFIPVASPILAPGDFSSLAIDFDHAVNELARGWLLSRGDTIWSSGTESLLRFYVTPAVKLLTIRLEAFLPTEHSSRDMFMSVNGKSAGSVTFDDAHHIRDVTLELPEDHAEQIDVTVRMSPNEWPAELGLPESQRKLGVKFSSVTAN